MNENDKKENESPNKPSGSESELKDLLSCTFCKKKQQQVRWLIAGEGVFICDECVRVCANLIDQEKCKLKISEYEKMLEQSESNLKEVLNIINGDKT